MPYFFANFCFYFSIFGKKFLHSTTKNQIKHFHYIQFNLYFEGINFLHSSFLPEEHLRCYNIYRRKSVKMKGNVENIQKILKEIICTFRLERDIAEKKVNETQSKELSSFLPKVLLKFPQTTTAWKECFSYLMFFKKTYKFILSLFMLANLLGRASDVTFLDSETSLW